jgi:hypothetical protein
MNPIDVIWAHLLFHGKVTLGPVAENEFNWLLKVKINCACEDDVPHVMVEVRKRAKKQCSSKEDFSIMQQQDFDNARISRSAWRQQYDIDCFLNCCLWHFNDIRSSKEFAHTLCYVSDLISYAPIVRAVDKFSRDQTAFGIYARKLLLLKFANALVNVIMAYFPSASRYKEKEHLDAKKQFMETRGYCEIIDCCERRFYGGKRTFSGKARCKAHLLQ